MRRLGIEPSSTAWKAAMLATTPPTLPCDRIDKKSGRDFQLFTTFTHANRYALSYRRRFQEMHNQSSVVGFHGVMVSTLDFESSDPSSNLGGTSERMAPCFRLLGPGRGSSQ